MNIRLQIHFLTIVVILFLCSCDKDTGPIQQEIPPSISTFPITNITATSASGGGNVLAQGSSSVTARGVCWSLSKKPTISNSKTDDDSGMGSFTSSISGLSTGTTYYVRAYATNNAGTSYGNEVSFNSGSCVGTPTVTYSGKTYNTIQIGSQCWLRENLDVGTMMNGTKPTNNNVIEKYCYNNHKENCTTYGGLYQWNEAMQYSTLAGAQGICPPGWHIPIRAEYEKLRATMNNDGNALKAIGQGSGSGAGTNTSGFSALFSGNHYSWFFNGLGKHAYFWSSTTSAGYYSLNAYGLILPSDLSVIVMIDQSKGYGYSVRCIKD